MHGIPVGGFIQSKITPEIRCKFKLRQELSSNARRQLPALIPPDCVPLSSSTVEITPTFLIVIPFLPRH